MATKMNNTHDLSASTDRLLVTLECDASLLDDALMPEGRRAWARVRLVLDVPYTNTFGAIDAAVLYLREHPRLRPWAHHIQPFLRWPQVTREEHLETEACLIAEKAMALALTQLAMHGWQPRQRTEEVSLAEEDDSAGALTVLEPYSMGYVAHLLGVTYDRARRIAIDRGVGRKHGDEWSLTAADVAVMRARNTQRGRPPLERN